MADELFRVLNPGLQSTEVISVSRQRENQVTAANDARNAQIAQRQSYGTDSGSTERVPTTGKSGSRSLLNGGLTAYKSQINPTDFIPDPNQSNTAQTPDFYREGKLDSVTRIVNNEAVQVTEWAPVPELIAERDRPVLASIRLVDPRKIKNNGPNSGTPKDAQLIPEYSKFFLEAVQESENERFQIVETFNDFYVYFHGKKPPIYTFSGHLLNLLNYNWMNEFMYYYENFWRGTKAVELGARVFLTYNYQQIQGYILNVGTNLNALTDKAVPFQFSMIVTKRLIFNGTPDDGVIRDNLLPRSDTGLINTTASSFAKALTSEFLDGQKPASGNQVATAQTQSLGSRIISDNLPSTFKQIIPSAGGINPFGSTPAGAQRASFLTRNLGIA